MARPKRLSLWLMLGSTLNLLLPTSVVNNVRAETPIPSVTQRTDLTAPIDVALDANHRLHGKLVNAEGIALAHANVQLFRAADLITAAKTDAQGKFQTDAIGTGSCQLVTAHQTVNLRVWTRNAAPPTASQHLLVAETGVIRGQCAVPGCEVINCNGSCAGGAYGGMFGMFFHPLVLGAAVAAAIAIPIALDDDDDDAS